MDIYRTKEFKELKSEWYSKLKDDGFRDIEYENKDSLIDWVSDYFIRNYNLESFKAKEEYYIRATKLVMQYNFKNETEREILEMHASGATLNFIAKNLFYVAPFPHRILLSRVRTTVSKFKMVMMEVKL